MKEEQQKLSNYELFLFISGRINQRTFINAGLFLIIMYINCLLILTYINKLQSVIWFINILFGWFFLAIASKRLHDLNKSAKNLLYLILPVAGPLYIGFLTLFKKGNKKINSYGLRLEDEIPMYFKNKTLANQTKGLVIVNDASNNNPISVKMVIEPKSIDSICEILKNSDHPVSISGARFSSGGQTASPDTLHLDMRKMNRILNFSLENKTIKVEAGIRWCDIQKVINQFNFSIKIMQTYANFTVGGSLSVNVHGRYIGLGPLILSVRSITLVLADGSIITATPITNCEYFYGAIGGYGGIGVIAHAEFDLVDNINIMREHIKMPLSDYLGYFKQNIRNNNLVVMHNADIYPPHYKKCHAVSWVKTDKKKTIKRDLQITKIIRPIHRYFVWAISETPLGKWRREHIMDRLLFIKTPIHSRNYEAGYDVAELLPFVTKRKFWTLQEYFIPIEKFDQFSAKMVEILKRYKVNMLNISIRHSIKDPGSYLAWAREEVFAFVFYFKQASDLESYNKVGIWTREIIDAVIECGGTYYLPYQIFATPEQFHKVFGDGAKKYFDLKTKIDPNYRLRNTLLDTYYKPYLTSKQRQYGEFNG